MAGGIPPILARVLRGERTESAHRGHVAAVSSGGLLVASAGIPDTPIYLRSAAKPFQAMPLLEAGGESAFRLSSAEIALMCSSHGGEPRHVRAVQRLLGKGGFRARDLFCGAHLPMHEPSARALLRRAVSATRLHNNCSGKHAGLLLACRLYGYPPRGYWRPSHPIQKEILSRVAVWTGVPAAAIGIAVDGCSLPVFHLPLQALARAYALLVSREAGPVASRIVEAMWTRPEMMAGRDRFTTALLAAGAGRYVGKEGAEGVYAIGIRRPRSAGSLGIVFKIEDGGTRARDAVSLDLIARFGRMPSAAARALSAYRCPMVRDARGVPVGRIEAQTARAVVYRKETRS